MKLKHFATSFQTWKFGWKTTYAINSDNLALVNAEDVALQKIWACHHEEKICEKTKRKTKKKMSTKSEFDKNRGKGKGKKKQKKEKLWLKILKIWKNIKTFWLTKNLIRFGLRIT